MIKYIKNMSLKKKILFTSFVVLSSLFVLPIFIGGIMPGHDMMFHLSRFNGICDAFNRGNIFPYIYEGMNSGQGYAAGIFYPAFFMYPFAILATWGVPKTLCLFLYYATMNTITTFSIYKLGKEFARYKDINNPTKFGAILAFICFFDVYRFINYYVRAAVGEFSAFAFVPLAILCFYRILKGENKYLSFAMAMGCVFANHTITTIILSAMFLLLLIINIKKVIKNPKILLTIIKAAGIFLIITAIIWMPMIECLDMCDLMFENSFQSFGTVSDNLNIRIGIPSVLSIFLTFIFLLFCVFATSFKARIIQITVFSVFCMTDVMCWNLLDGVLGVVQFPWRILSIVFVSAAMFMLLLWHQRTSKLFKQIMFVALIGAICLNSMAIAYKMIPGGFSDSVRENYRISSETVEVADNMGQMEFAPLDMYKNNLDIFKNQDIKTLSCKYDISKLNDYGVFEEVKNGEKYQLAYTALVSKEELVVPKVYYPGCKAVIDGKFVNCKAGPYGFITVSSPRAYGIITVWYELTEVQICSIIVSILGLIGVFLLDFYRKTLIYLSQQEDHVPKVRAVKVKTKKKR